VKTDIMRSMASGRTYFDLLAASCVLLPARVLTVRSKHVNTFLKLTLVACGFVKSVNYPTEWLIC